MIELIKFACGGFWRFIGVFLIFWLAANVILQIIVRIIRCITVSMKGWPPSHLDADGDFKQENEN